jgi:hypothetical protein
MQIYWKRPTTLLCFEAAPIFMQMRNYPTRKIGRGEMVASQVTKRRNSEDSTDPMSNVDL